MQVHGRAYGEVRDPSTRAVPRLPGPTAEAQMHQGAGSTFDHRKRCGCAPTGQDVRRSGSLPQVLEVGR